MFDRAYQIVVGIEGKFSKDPKDKGNWTGGEINKGELKGTMMGISAAQYPHLDIENLTPSEVKALYLTDYWNINRCGEMTWPFALMTFDCGVNQGTNIAARFLQDALGIVPDERVGPHTVGATWNANYRQVARFNSLRAQRYFKTSGYKDYGNGWLIRLALVTMEAVKT